VLGSHAGGTEEFGLEVVVGEEFVYSPERSLPSRSEEMSVNVDEGVEARAS